MLRRISNRSATTCSASSSRRESSSIAVIGRTAVAAIASASTVARAVVFPRRSLPPTAADCWPTPTVFHCVSAPSPWPKDWRNSSASASLDVTVRSPSFARWEGPPASGCLAVVYPDTPAAAPIGAPPAAAPPLFPPVPFFPTSPRQLFKACCAFLASLATAFFAFFPLSSSKRFFSAFFSFGVRACASNREPEPAPSQGAPAAANPAAVAAADATAWDNGDDLHAACCGGVVCKYPPVSD
mmetsp:Transcript_23099/g.57223  ORF Transcript_23099/g.57223 Transcript_23099/m.57223 type:complete len:241 (+) Transcript_23099:2174-2896(+)